MNKKHLPATVICLLSLIGLATMPAYCQFPGPGNESTASLGRKISSKTSGHCAAGRQPPRINSFALIIPPLPPVPASRGGCR
jgi:hypothetical protein